MTAWAWYLEREDEITVDLDRITRRGLMDVQRKVAELREGLIGLDSVWLYPSAAPWHYHLITVLSEPMDVWGRIALSLILGNDPRRAARGLLRAATGHRAPNLLIAPDPWPGFHREPDHLCSCAGHKSLADMAACSVGSLYRWSDELAGASDGAEPWSEFGRVE